MSDAQEGFEPISTEADPGAATAGGEQITDLPEAPAREYFDLDEVGDRFVRLKIDGEDIEVPVAELRAGYSRQADYTRKTQELAEQRKQAEYALTLKAALEAQPEETIRLLARQHGLTLAEQQQLRDQAAALQPDEDEFSDPLERKVVGLERQLQIREQREQQEAADRQLRQAIGGLQNRYQADDATVRQVVQTALQMNTGPDSFDTIYKGIMFDRMQQARQQAQQQRATEDQQRQAAAQQAGQVTGAGASANGAGAPPPKPTSYRTYREAIEASFDELGVQ